MNDVSDTPLPRLPERPPESHKGDFGRAMIIGGSRGMPGAVALSGMACLRSGIGLATLAVPRSIQQTVASYCAAYTTQDLVEDDGGVLHWANVFDLEPLEDRFNVWAIGPGLGNPDYTADLVGRMFKAWIPPLIVDADGLNALSVYEQHRGGAMSNPLGSRVLTPHPGEFARLIEDESVAELATGPEMTKENDEQRIEAATTLARRDETGSTTVLLKGSRTVITDGERYAINTTGNPGMATGGSGDVLTGMITALVGQGMQPFNAARLAAHVHGTAGDLAAERQGQVSLIATDLIDALPDAWQAIQARRASE